MFKIQGLREEGRVEPCLFRSVKQGSQGDQFARCAGGHAPAVWVVDACLLLLFVLLTPTLIPHFHSANLDAAGANPKDVSVGFHSSVYELNTVPYVCSYAAFPDVAPGRRKALPGEVVEVGVQRHIAGSCRRLVVVGLLPFFQHLAITQLFQVGGWLPVRFPLNLKQLAGRRVIRVVLTSGAGPFFVHQVLARGVGDV